MSYFLAVGSEQRGPFAKEQLLSQGLAPQTLVWAEGMPQWVRADSVPELASLFVAAPGAAPMQGAPVYQQQPQMQQPQPVGYATPMGAPPFDKQKASSTKLACGLCGILLNGLGIHKFIYGATGAGLTMLLVTILTCGFGGIIMGVIGIIEGIIYLTKSDEEFYQLYMVQKKAWF